MDLESVLQAEVTADVVLQTQLASGEQVLWRGRPRTGLLWPERSTLQGQILALAIATALCVLVLTAFRNPSPVLQGGAVVLPLVALYKLIGAPLLDAREREQTSYALTDRRVLTVRGTPVRRKIQSLPLKEIAGITTTEFPGGGGTIHLGLSRRWRLQGELRFIERPREVSLLIRQAQLAARFPETLGSSATQVSSAL